MARRMESHLIAGPAGQLEALLEEPENGGPREACLICHPHPLGGGTMLNKVVHRIARGMRLSGAVALRFNFRGVGRSQGEHAHGIGELEDARAAFGWLRARYPDLPCSLAGFSFGSRIILKLGCEAPIESRLLAVGFPTRMEKLPFLETCSASKHFIQSTNDQFGPLDELRPLFSEMAEPKSLMLIEAADHFFAGGLDELEHAVRAFGSNEPRSAG